MQLAGMKPICGQEETPSRGVAHVHPDLAVRHDEPQGETATGTERRHQTSFGTTSESLSKGECQKIPPRVTKSPAKRGQTIPEEASNTLKLQLPMDCGFAPHGKKLAPSHAANLSTKTFSAKIFQGLILWGVPLFGESPALKNRHFARAWATTKTSAEPTTPEPDLFALAARTLGPGAAPA